MLFNSTEQFSGPVILYSRPFKLRSYKVQIPLRNALNLYMHSL